MDINFLRQFNKKPLIDCEEQIKKIAAAHMLTLNICDPRINTHAIMTDPSRLNVYTDDDGVITRFSIG